VAAETNPPPGSQPFLVARRVAGISGRELLSDDEGAARLGAAMGRLLPGIAAVPAAGLRLSRTWADAGRLVAAATRWLAGAAPVLAPAEVGRLRGWIDRLPERYEDVRPVFAHGDFVPVNVLMRGGSAGVEAEVAALLDLERARIAHPLYDAARWWAVVGYHHPDRLEVASRAFSATAGLVLDPRARADLAVLGALQLLEEISRAGGTGTLPRRTGMLRSYMRGTPSVAFSR
jgi:aminoglycoside phosphotransferase (APT) family kinase protein